MTYDNNDANQEITIKFFINNIDEQIRRQKLIYLSIPYLQLNQTTSVTAFVQCIYFTWGF